MLLFFARIQMSVSSDYFVSELAPPLF